MGEVALPDLLTHSCAQKWPDNFGEADVIKSMYWGSI